MNTTTFKRRTLSPIQPHPIELARKRAMDTQDPEHVMRKEIQKLCGTYQFTATFSEDTDTLATFRHVPGLIAVQCLLKDKDGKPVGKGHGSAILTRINRGIERTAFICLNASFLSAANSACKVMDSLRLDTHDLATPKDLGGAYRAREDEGSHLASDKQKAYLRQLISLNVEDEAERERWEAGLDSMTREDASEAIGQFAR
ncbi:hypothetical protein A3C18_01125 [Candidatus Kaiserbacteria bacterium RIFCSPHIGHO2_02_FULL_54_11b]|uniref:Uncharacterized protein n=2 Tax=Candidatus Kaiseribacteriota TaxID=1752734 RepID=A0A1F6CK92_9BACT|nr:MAG: hypothetical protein A2704_04365 [Candidatus Kaiserbacteria bacterium RIFCSPHIGHO2_01_FULL_54_36b]OGG64811.1 MAG: hypothetical protein A3C18_01125 [Candidatus Kaiserbacteria bacterium RIFCSPHIGHO2_02_FULL_54_11b]